MTRFIAIGCIGFGLLAPLAVAQETQTMQQAIQWQHQKDAADARQAALEAKHPSVTEPGSSQSATQSSADREDMSQPSSQTTGSADRMAPSASFRTEPTSAELQRALAFQHAKDKADARQAALEARHPSVTEPANGNQ